MREHDHDARLAIRKRYLFSDTHYGSKSSVTSGNDYLFSLFHSDSCASSLIDYLQKNGGEGVLDQVEIES